MPVSATATPPSSEPNAGRARNTAGAARASTAAPPETNAPPEDAGGSGVDARSSGTRAPGAWSPKTSTRRYAEETTCAADPAPSPEAAEPKRTRVCMRAKSAPETSSTDPPPARARGDGEPGVQRLTRAAARNSSCAADPVARVSAEEKEKRGASVEPERGGFVRAPVVARERRQRGHRGEPRARRREERRRHRRRSAARRAKKRGGASATKTIAPPEASDAAPSVSRATGAALGTTPSRRGVKGATTSNANPGGIRAWFDSAGDRRAPTATFAEGAARRAANVASEALPGVSATGANVPNVAASESSADTARRRAPVSVTRAPPCGVTDTGDTSRIVGGGVATSVAAALALAPTPNASAPASATRAIVRARRKRRRRLARDERRGDGDGDGNRRGERRRARAGRQRAHQRAVLVAAQVRAGDENHRAAAGVRRRRRERARARGRDVLEGNLRLVLWVRDERDF